MLLTEIGKRSPRYKKLYNFSYSFLELLAYTKQKATATVETLSEIIKKTLESGEDVLVSGFGKFFAKEKGEVEAGTYQLAVV